MRREPGRHASDASHLEATRPSQPIDNHAPENPLQNGRKQTVLYQAKSSSYYPRDGRLEPPSQKDLKMRRRPRSTPAVPTLISERQRLVALIARMPDEVLKEALPKIESTLQRASRQPCAKTPGGSPPAQNVGDLVFRKAARECSKDAGRTKDRHSNGKVKRLPALEKPLRWPTKKFSKEFHRRGISIVAFLRDEWAALVAAGYGELRWLRMVDPSAAAAVENFERRDPRTKKHKQLPPDIRFLREREVIDLKLAMGLSAAARNDPRLLDAASRRLRRGVSVLVG